MAVLRPMHQGGSPAGAQVHYLLSKTTVGRASQCELRLSRASVSSLHAYIEWLGHGWVVRDLGSRNGTFLNGKELSGAQRGALRDGDVVTFGSKLESWQVVNAGPPRPLLVREDHAGRGVHELHEVHPLPSENQPDATLYARADQFLLELPGEPAQVIEAGERFVVGDATYRLLFSEPGATLERATTRRTSAKGRPSLSDCQVVIRVASDEESAGVSVTCGDFKRSLPNRAHRYLLAHLARLRIEADAAGNADGGWQSAEDLADALRVDANYLSVQVFRIRKDFERLGLRDAAGIVDRGRRGLMRLGVPPTRVTLLHESSHARDSAGAHPAPAE